MRKQQMTFSQLASNDRYEYENAMDWATPDLGMPKVRLVPHDRAIAAIGRGLMPCDRALPTIVPEEDSAFHAGSLH